MDIRTRPKLGDIVEIPVPGRGFSYAQYVNHHRNPPGLGALLRILPGLFKKRPADVFDLISRDELYYVFFPLGASCHRGYVRIVCNAPIPNHLKDKWPLFKGCNMDPDTGEKTWFLWDGNKSRMIGNLGRKYLNLSIDETVNLAELENRLRSGWLPRDEA